MPLASPNLDDRDFQTLLDEAVHRVQLSCPEWTDLKPGDPGMALLEVFAHLTEVMLYRLNRLPEKAYIEYLRLLGVKLHPPAAARVTLQFTLSRAESPPVEVPRGTRVTVGAAGGVGEPPVFVTAASVTVGPGAATEVEAYHCDWVQAEPAGVGTGLPGQAVVLRRPPIVAPTGDDMDLVVGVEAEPGELAGREPAWEWEGRPYRLWREAASFSDVDPDAHAYLTDRAAGRITFAPAVQRSEGAVVGERQALARVPPAGRRILVWYRRGGGPEGNVQANVLTALKDPVAGVQVTNPGPAAGGRAGESVENALLRGPLELHASRLAVTAADFERIAVAGGAARARAYTQRQLWAHAAPGTVEVRVVPDVPATRRGPGLTAARLREYESEQTRAAIARALEERRPLGTACDVGWVRYKTVRVAARAVVHRGEDRATVKGRVLARLYDVISPLPQGAYPGWGFGQPLRASQVYDLLLEEPGVSYADQLRLLVDDVPGRGVTSLAADAYQRRTWYAAAGDTVYRSGNDGDGWEPVAQFPGEDVKVVRTFPGRPDLPQTGRAGLVAVATARKDTPGASRVRVSWDCCESWDPDEAWRQTGFAINGLAWMVRDGTPLLLLASDAGLFTLGRGTGLVPWLVDLENQKRGFYDVAVAADARGGVGVAAAAQAKSGVWFSAEGGARGSFKAVGLRGEDVRVVRVQYDGPRTFLWAGAYAEGEVPGTGCSRCELLGAGLSQEGWKKFSKGWTGGSCRELALHRSRAFAATFRAGVLSLDLGAADPAWVAPDFAACGWPVRGPKELERVNAAACDPDGRLLLVGGPPGVYSSRDGAASYETCSRREFTDRVTLPEAWLVCSGEHDIEVVAEGEGERP
jgi:hypothetical protein